MTTIKIHAPLYSNPETGKPYAKPLFPVTIVETGEEIGRFADPEHQAARALMDSRFPDGGVIKMDRWGELYDFDIKARAGWTVVENAYQSAHFRPYVPFPKDRPKSA